MKFSAEEFKGWIQEEITIEFFKFLAREEHAHRMVVAEGVPLSEDTNEKILKSLFMHLNKADVYYALQQVQYEDLEDDGSDSSIGTQATD